MADGIAPPPMHLTQRHVFTPVFHLARWAGPDGRVCSTCNIFGTLAQFRIDPADATFEYYLYVDHQDFSADERAAIDRNFVRPLSAAGDRIVSRLVAGAPLDEVDTLLWALFLASMRQRPSHARAGRRPSPDAAADAPAQGLRRLAEGDRHDATAARAHWRPALRAAKAHADPSGLLPDLALDRGTLDRLLALDWFLLDLEAAAQPLFTSDRPLVRTRPLDDAECVVALPLSPTLAFFAMASGAFARRALLATEDAERLATALNLGAVGQALRFAYSRNGRDASERFLRRHVPFVPEN